MAISLLYNPFPMRLFEADGDFASGALAYFYLARTTTPLIVYVDAPLTTAHTWPVVADAYGLLPPVYIEKGEEYKVRIEDALGSLLYAADGISNPDEAEAAAGGGVAPSSDQIFQTGHFAWQPITGVRPGWVRCNGRTISKTAGTGTEANDDNCEALFAFFWNNFSDTLCPVTPGGRGANAGADWSIAKSIATLDMRGRTAAGLDTMGNTAKNIVQKQTTINTTNASSTAVAADATGLCIGMFVVSANVPRGTTITQVNPTTKNVAMSQNATATATGTAAQFSLFASNPATIFGGAEEPGAPGGAGTHRLDLYEMPSHSHTTTGVGSDNYIGRMTSGGTFNITGGGPADGYGSAANEAAGLDAPHANLPPTTLGTWYAKR